MSDPTYRVIEITGTSGDDVTSAVSNGVARANSTVRNLDWLEVTNIRARIEGGAVVQYQVTMKVGFRLEGRADEAASA
jgi:flavin-binding protein dodecin